MHHSLARTEATVTLPAAMSAILEFSLLIGSRRPAPTRIACAKVSPCRPGRTCSVRGVAADSTADCPQRQCSTLRPHPRAEDRPTPRRPLAHPSHPAACDETRLDCRQLHRRPALSAERPLRRRTAQHWWKRCNWRAFISPPPSARRPSWWTRAARRLRRALSRVLCAGQGRDGEGMAYCEYSAPARRNRA